MISILFLKPFIWILCDNDSVKARLVLLILTIVAWIALIIFVPVFMLVIDKSSSSLVWPITGGLVILAVVFVDSARNFYIEKRDENASARAP